jgi:hypothetical protein
MATTDLRRLTAREAGSALAARANRWMISGAVILAGGLAAVTAHAFHARSAGAVPSVAPAVAPAAPAAGSGQDDSAAPVQAPSQPPATAASTSSPAPVISGGS